MILKYEAALTAMALCLAAVRPLGWAAQEAGARPGTLIVAHGAGAEWNAQVEALAREVRTGGPVEVAFLMGPGARAGPFQELAARLVAAGATEIVVVPLLVSSHSGHYEQIRWLAGEAVVLDSVMLHHLHEAGLERARVAVPVLVTKAMDDAPEIAQVLADRALALGKEPSAEALLLVGHGPNAPEERAAWMSNLRRLAGLVQSRTGFRDVKAGVVQDDAPAAVRAEAVRAVRDVIGLQHDVTGRPVVVVPVLISTSPLSEERLREDLAHLPIVYSGEPLLPHPEIARWIEARVRAAVRREGTH
jgi:sirohydrochlorin ferrochelatase